MTSTLDLRDAIAQVRSTIEAGNLNARTGQACADRLAALGSEISRAIEAQFLVLVTATDSTAA